MKNRIEKITKMEDHLNKLQALITEVEIIREKWALAQFDFQELVSYYESDQWRDDVDAYDQELIPKDVRCGILSEDAIFNLMTEQHSAAIQMIKTAANILDS
jgi:hypothetical protein